MNSNSPPRRVGVLQRTKENRGQTLSRQLSAPRQGLTIDFCLLTFPSPSDHAHAKTESGNDLLPLWREAQIMSYFALIMGVSPSKAPVDLLYCPTSALVARTLPPLRAYIAQRCNFRKPAHLYVQWWRAAYYTSGIDICRDIIRDMHHQYGMPNLQLARQATAASSYQRRWSLGGDQAAKDYSFGGKRGLAKLLSTFSTRDAVRPTSLDGSICFSEFQQREAVLRCRDIENQSSEPRESFDFVAHLSPDEARPSQNSSHMDQSSLQGGSAAQVADIPDTASRQRPGRAAIQRPETAAAEVMAQQRRAKPKPLLVHSPAHENIGLVDRTALQDLPGMEAAHKVLSRHAEECEGAAMTMTAMARASDTPGSNHVSSSLEAQNTWPRNVAPMYITHATTLPKTTAARYPSGGEVPPLGKASMAQRLVPGLGYVKRKLSRRLSRDLGSGPVQATTPVDSFC